MRKRDRMQTLLIKLLVALGDREKDMGAYTHQMANKPPLHYL
jgi:hypothetical protein